MELRSTETEKEAPAPTPPCNLLPRGARVVVLTDDWKYSGRIVVPDSAKRRPTTGVVVAAGPDAGICYNEPRRYKEDGSADMECSGKDCQKLHIGDRVLYGQFSGTFVVFKGKPGYTVLGVDEILAKVMSDEILEYTASG